jgi:hypothetical protein
MFVMKKVKAPRLESGSEGDDPMPAAGEAFEDRWLGGPLLSHEKCAPPVLRLEELGLLPRQET